MIQQEMTMKFEHNIDAVCKKVTLEYSCEYLHNSIRSSLLSRQSTIASMVSKIQSGQVSPKTYELLIEEQKYLLELDLQSIFLRNEKIKAIANMALYELTKNKVVY